MLEEKGKRVFTADELRQIIMLVRQKEQADASTQKIIRRRLRKIGLYWEEIVGKGVEYNISNLQNLFERGILRIEGVNYDVPNEISKEPETIQDDGKEVVTLDNNYIRGNGRKNSDEHYVINLCDKVLGMAALRQYRFDFLKGDSGRTLPVDAYYPTLNLVIEYHESQHTESTPFFDRRKTVSGVSRGEQRRIYDRRRQEMLPLHGIKLVIISYTDFGLSKKLVRDNIHDLNVVRNVLLSAGVKVVYDG